MTIRASKIASIIMPLDFSKQEPNWDILLRSIERAEGGDKASVPFGILSVKTKGKDDARQIALNTAKNNFKRWNSAGQPGNYIDFLANRYTPVAHDPQGNINWKKNVSSIYSQLSAKKEATKPAPSAAPAPALDPLLLQPLPPVNYPAFPMYPLVKR